MLKQCVKWKPVRKTNTAGREYDSEIPIVIDNRYRGTLLTVMLQMPPKSAITFDQAITLVSLKMSEAFDLRQLGNEPGHYNWYLNNFTEWISNQGFHIEISGDEFESYALSDKVA